MKSTRDEEFHAYVFERRVDLLRTATLLTAGDRHLAEDLVQSTLTKLYLSWSLFTKAANREGYARRVLVNALVDEHRRPWRRRERLSATAPERPSAPPEVGTPRTEALSDALRRLPPRMRAVVVYRYFQDLSVADTAEALSCSQGTVKSQTARALDQLREVLNTPSPGSLEPDNTIPATPAVASVLAIASIHHDRSF